MFASGKAAAVASAANYIEDVFSTYLYTGNGGGSATGFYGTQTITNGIDLASKGGLVWVKSRSGAEFHRLADTSRGVNNLLSTNSTSAQQTGANTITAFNSTGFNLGSDSDGYGTNTNATTYASWTFRKQPKFFDVVTTTSQTVSHSLGSVAGFVIWKRTDATEDWNVLARKSDGSYVQLNLNLTDGAFASYANASAAGITSTNITLPSFATGGTYVVYLFAHNAGGFGLTGTDNVISCGSFTTDGAGYATVDLGYEPQWVLTKATSAVSNWRLTDTMRGYLGGVIPTSNQVLYPDLSNAEANTTAYNGTINATGFVPKMDANTTFIYIAIRRGPMKVPTSGTSVFTPVLRTGTGAAATVSTGNTPDWIIIKQQLGSSGNAYSRLQGSNRQLYTELTNAEVDQGTAYGVTSFLNISFTLGLSANGENQNGRSLINWTFSRAPSFFDEVCYSGTGSATTQTHNLGVAPELVIWKRRSSTSDWRVWQSSFSVNDGLYLNYNFAKDTDSNVQTAVPTASVLNLATGAYTNASGSTYVAYLFATCAGVSKCTAFTGTGALQTIDCGFTSGARFVLIKRTDSTGDWYVWDSSRGLSSSTDPYLLLNSTAAEVTSTNWVDTTSTGFQVTAASGNNVNINGASYIALAIA